jgi:hypothetical protein
MESEVVELEDELLIGELLDEDEPAASEEPPQAARPSGRAMVRAARVLRRASRMVSLLVREVLALVIRCSSRSGLLCRTGVSAWHIS